MLKEAFELGVLQALNDAGVIKYAGVPTSELLNLAYRSQLPKPGMGARLMEMLRSAKTELPGNPNVQRAALGAGVGGTAGAVTGDDDSSMILRALVGAGMGGAAGGLAVPAIHGAQGLFGARRMQKALQSMATRNFGTEAQQLNLKGLVGA